MTDSPEPALSPAAVSLWTRAAPWFAAYGALLLILAQLRLPAGVSRGVVLAASLVVSLAVIFLASAALYAVARERLSPRALALLFAGGGLLFLVNPGFGLLWRTLHGPPPPRPLMDLVVTIGSLGVLCLGAAIGATVASLI